MVATETPPRKSLNAFCAKGVAAKKRARAEREARQVLMAHGVVDEEVLTPTSAREPVSDVFAIDPAWLTDEFLEGALNKRTLCAVPPSLLR